MRAYRFVATGSNWFTRNRRRIRNVCRIRGNHTTNDLLVVFTVIAIGVLFHMLWQLPKGDRFQTTAIGLITSGAVGNCIDRIEKQSVTDFLRVFSENETAITLFGKWFGRRKVQGGPVELVEWPSFNVADAAICIGLGMFFFHYLFLEKDEENVDDLSPAETSDAEPIADSESPTDENNPGVA